MIIALRQQITFRNEKLEEITLNHWVIEDIIHRVGKEKVILSVDGYTNRQSRLDNESPVIENLRLVVENTHDEDGNILTSDYNKYLNYQSLTLVAKHRNYIKETAIEALKRHPDFINATDD